MLETILQEYKEKTRRVNTKFNEIIMYLGNLNIEEEFSYKIYEDSTNNYYLGIYKDMAVILFCNKKDEDLKILTEIPIEIKTSLIKKYSEIITSLEIILRKRIREINELNLQGDFNDSKI